MNAAKLLNFMLGLVCAMLVMSSGLTAYFMFFDEPFLTYENLPFPAMKEQLAPGEMIPVKIRKCNNSHEMKVYVVTRVIHEIDTNLHYALPDHPAVIPPGCLTTITTVHAIPANMPNGRYRVFGTAEFRGRFRMHSVEWFSTPFLVMAKK